MELGDIEDNEAVKLLEKEAMVEPLCCRPQNNLSELNESAALAEDQLKMVIMKIDLISPLLRLHKLSSAPFDGDFDAINNVPWRGVLSGLFRQLNLVIEDPKKRLIAGHFVNALGQAVGLV